MNPADNPENAFENGDTTQEDHQQNGSSKV